jgi:ornithine cyclodeaminase/alanine dehydrogenase
VLVWGEVVASLREAYSVPHGPKISPPRVVARGDRTGCAHSRRRRRNRAHGREIFGAGRQGMVTYLIALFEQESGVLAGLIDANLVTAYRTGATAVAVDRIEPKSAISLGVLGSGLEAQSLCAPSPASARSSRSRSTRRRSRGARRSPTLSPMSWACPAREFARGGGRRRGRRRRSRALHDETPVLLGRWLRPGMLVVSIG